MIGVVRKFAGFKPSKEDQYAKFWGIEHKTCWAHFYLFSDDKTLLLNMESLVTEVAA